MVRYITHTSCSAYGFSLQIAWKAFDKECSSFDVVVVLEVISSLGGARLESQPFYISVTDIRRLAEYLVTDSEAKVGVEQYPYIPMNLGFEIVILDRDAEEATIQVLLNLGIHNERRVYCGCRSQVSINEITNLATSLRNVIASYGQS